MLRCACSEASKSHVNQNRRSSTIFPCRLPALHGPISRPLNATVCSLAPESPAHLPAQVNIAVMATVKGGKRTLLPLLARAEWHMHHGSIGASAIRHRNLSPAAWNARPPHGSCHRLMTPFLLTDLGFLSCRADLGCLATGLMFGARALATLLCTLPAAALADRFGRKCAILPGLATEAAAMLVMAAARELSCDILPALALLLSHAGGRACARCLRYAPASSPKSESASVSRRQVVLHQWLELPSSCLGTVLGLSGKHER